MRDVAKRPCVHQRRLPFQGLHQVRLDRVLHHHRHRPGHAQHLGGDRLPRVGRGHHDAAEPLPQVLQVARQREYRHHLRRRRDHELVLARHPVRLPAQPHHRVAQLAVVHVQRPRPHHRRRVDAQRVAVVDRRIERRRQQVVRRRHRVEIAVEVEVDVFHRPHLRVAAAGAAALDPEDRAHRRLPQAQHHLLPELAEPHRQRHAGRRLALARLGRRDGRDDHKLAVRAALQPLEQSGEHLAAILPRGLQLLGLDAGCGGNVGNRTQLGFLGDLER